METAGPITYGQSIEDAKKKLADAIEKKWNVLTALDSLINIPPDHKVSVEKIEFSADPKDREVYLQEGKEDDPIEKKRYALAKNGLLRIAQNGGVQIDHAHSGRIDDMRSKEYIAWRVVGAAQRLDGSWFPLAGSYDIDFEIVLEQIIEGKRKSAAYWKQEWWLKKSKEEKEAHIQKLAREDYLRFKRYGMGRCETGALTRLIRGCFPLMKGLYRHEEVIKPFVVARLVYQPNQNDPMIRAQMSIAFLNSMKGVYGIPAPAIPQIPAQVVDMESGNGHSFEMPEAERIPEEPEMPTGEEAPRPKSIEQQKIDFQNSDLEGKVQTLDALMNRVNYDRSKLKQPLAKYSEKALTTFFENLVSQLAKQEDDIPV